MACEFESRTLRSNNFPTFVHIDPRSKGGSKEIDNLGICCCEANRAKSDMTVEQLLELCQEILEHHGCKVIGREPDIG